MTFEAYFKALRACELIAQDKWFPLQLAKGMLPTGTDWENPMKLLAWYFVLQERGNIYMSLEQNTLQTKLTEILNAQKAYFDENGVTKPKDFDELEVEMPTVLSGLGQIPTLPIMGNKALFLIENNRLYARKYKIAKDSAKDSVNRLFVGKYERLPSPLPYESAVKSGFQLTDRQKDIIEKGVSSNLLVTGGPGTGKTTSIFFLLLELLLRNQEKKQDQEIYLTAFSGKAAARMKESVQSNMNNVEDSFRQNNAGILDKLEHLESYTIHRLLQIDTDNGGFRMNRTNPFPENSIFVIDEASMIDIELFAALLEAIPDTARVFILGDKDQLPSVGCGAVFADLLEYVGYANRVILEESKRFPKGSEIDLLAHEINRGAIHSVTEKDWQPATAYLPVHPGNPGTNPIYYYLDTEQPQAPVIQKMADAWYKEYHQVLQAKCKAVDPAAPALQDLEEIALKARILCANNRGIRGTDSINRYLLQTYFSKENLISGYHPGELLMITKNNSALDLYNGDCGVAVKFDGDDTLYVMFRKATHLQLLPGKKVNQIFCLEDRGQSFVFYPLRMIGREDITSAFAITIHKSQGSDFGNILVILPKQKGHPLMNRQILYTAITRTKGETHIFSNQENLEAAARTRLERDTGIFT